MRGSLGGREEEGFRWREMRVWMRATRMLFRLYWRVAVMRAEVMNDAGIVRRPPGDAVWLMYI